MNPIVIIEGDYWQALYIEGEKVTEDHRINLVDIVKHTAEYVGREGNPTVQLHTAYLEEGDLDEYGEAEYFDNLEDFSDAVKDRISL